MKRTLLAAIVATMPAAVAAQQAAPAPEVSFGAAATSNYIFRGTSQTDDKPALQGYVEGALAGFYAGAWASTVDIDDDRVELDLYAGYRASFGALEADVGYVRYLYDDSGDCCGEGVLGLDYTIERFGSVGGSYYRDFDLDTDWAEARATFDFAELWSASGTIGSDFGSFDLDRGDKVAWDLGVSRTLGEPVTVDLRFHDSNDDPGRLVLSIAADF